MSDFKQSSAFGCHLAQYTVFYAVEFLVQAFGQRLIELAAGYTFGLGGVHLRQFVFARRNLRSNQACLFSALGNAPQIKLTKVVFGCVRDGNVRINDIVVNTVSTVLIPTSLPLLISGLRFVSLFGRRRNKIKV